MDARKLSWWRKKDSPVSQPHNPVSRSRTQVAPAVDPNDSVGMTQNTPKHTGPFNFLAPMFSIYCGNEKERDNLHKQYPWLEELTRFKSKREQSDSVEQAFRKSRNTFNRDGKLFMIVLRRYIKVELQLELYFNFVEDKTHGVKALHLLHCLSEREQSGKLAPAPTREEHWRYSRVPFEDACIPEKEQHSWSIQMVKDRRPTDSDSAPDLHKRFDVSSHFEEHMDDIFKSFHKSLDINKDRAVFEDWLLSLNKRYWRVLNRDVDDLAFCINDTEHGWTSPLWLQLGKNLSSLAEFIGVAADRWCFLETGSPAILGAFGKLAAEQRPDLDSVQKIIHEQDGVIQKQEQVITALRFRHLLENLPGARRARQSGTAKWVEFWKNAVRTAWRNRHDPDPVGPLDKLLRDQFRKADRKNYPHVDSDGKKLTEEEVDKMKLDKVLSEFEAKRGSNLYSILSQVIHGYQDQEFKVNPQSFSPDDVAIMEALAPANIEDGEVLWEKERERYFPAEEGGLLTPDTPGAGDGLSNRSTSPSPRGSRPGRKGHSKTKAKETRPHDKDE
ncbi:hypothetical protein QBC39DRAFT_101855 [Podospora conica]|nr:hypothetical protein QBC39DRAFT_101855 [Schizothecium conicum]